MKLLYVIPSYEPDETLPDVVSGLMSVGETPCVVVVDDGSGEAYRHFFDEAKQRGATVLRHGVNLGKGRALKTAFNWFLNHAHDCDGVLTLDADGQHTAEDVIRCGEAFAGRPDSIVLGSRDFDARQVPLKSRAGNKITRAVLRYFCGITLSDTQTGLRVLPRTAIPMLMQVKGERFEFETNMLLAAKADGIPLTETRISTVYMNGNAGTHFNPLRDAALIYAAFAKFILSSLASTGVDFLIFAAMVNRLLQVTPDYILISAVIARTVSAICNYAVNRKWVFKSSGRAALVKYGVLAVCQMLVSGYATTWLYGAFPMLGEVGAKIPVDVLLFLLSYSIQRTLIFTGKNAAPPKR